MTNIPAFPLATPKWHESVSDDGFQDIDFTMGMTLRDYFAASFVKSGHIFKSMSYGNTPKLLAEQAYAMADAMMTARDL
jgi:hypothetical protein